jgi:hypothetical protein
MPVRWRSKYSLFNLGTDPNQAFAINVQNRRVSVVNKSPPLVSGEGVKMRGDEYTMYVNLYSTDKKIRIKKISIQLVLYLIFYQELKGKMWSRFLLMS